MSIVTPEFCILAQIYMLLIVDIDIMIKVCYDIVVTIKVTSMFIFLEVFSNEKF